jgi:hypothetical protein
MIAQLIGQVIDLHETRRLVFDIERAGQPQHPRRLCRLRVRSKILGKSPQHGIGERALLVRLEIQWLMEQPVHMQATATQHDCRRRERKFLQAPAGVRFWGRLEINVDKEGGKLRTVV